MRTQPPQLDRGVLAACPSAGPGKGGIPGTKTRLLAHLLMGEVQTYMGKPQKGESKECGK